MHEYAYYVSKVQFHAGRHPYMMAHPSHGVATQHGMASVQHQSQPIPGGFNGVLRCCTTVV